MDSEGNESGNLWIDGEGLRIFDANGDLISFINETGSKHNVVEQFSSIFVPLLDSEGNPSGHIQINGNGFAIFDADGNATSFVDETGSTHKLEESFRKITLPLSSGGQVVLDGTGIKVLDSSGNVVNKIDDVAPLQQGGQAPQQGTIEVPITDSTGDSVGSVRSVRISSSGLSIFDASNNIVSFFNHDGSTHNKTEIFENIVVPLTDSAGNSTGTVRISSTGISVFDASNNIVSFFNHDGSTHNKTEIFENIVVPLTDSAGNRTGTVRIGSNGISVFDASNNLISHFSEFGSTHAKTETFETIEVPLTDSAGNRTGTVRIGSTGISVFDANNNLISTVDELGSVHNKKETFSELVVPLIDANGNRVGQIQINDEGLSVLDANDNFISYFNETGSEHKAPEEFSEITVPLVDDLGNDLGKLVLGPGGLLVFDANGALVSLVNEVGSNHKNPEIFSGGMVIPLVDSSGNPAGEVVIGQNGIEVKDVNGNVLSTINALGSVHNAPNGGTVGIESTGFSVYDSLGDALAWFSYDGSINATTVSASSIVAGKVTTEITDPLILESFPVVSGESYEPGDVLVIDPRGTGHVRLSFEAEDTGVIGIVGPGMTVDEDGEILAIILGAHGPLRNDGTRLEAFVKVDATYGVIEAGDLLTASPTSGHAMRASQPKLGTIVGKALEPLEEGQGFIRVFVTLN